MWSKKTWSHALNFSLILFSIFNFADNTKIGRYYIENITNNIFELAFSTNNSRSRLFLLLWSGIYPKDISRPTFRYSFEKIDHRIVSFLLGCLYFKNTEQNKWSWSGKDKKNMKKNECKLEIVQISDISWLML